MPHIISAHPMFIPKCWAIWETKKVKWLYQTELIV